MFHSGIHGGVHGSAMLLRSIMDGSRHVVFRADMRDSKSIPRRDQQYFVNTGQGAAHSGAITVGLCLSDFRSRQMRRPSRIAHDHPLDQSQF
jgi:hypothetical protein